MIQVIIRKKNKNGSLQRPTKKMFDSKQFAEIFAMVFKNFPDEEVRSMVITKTREIIEVNLL